MYLEKLPSGNFRIAKQINGKRYKLYFDHKPSKADIDQAVRDLSDDVGSYTTKNINFQKASAGYISMKSESLSASTKVGYRAILRTLSEKFKLTPINNIDQLIIQTELNEIAKRGLSHKTLKNVSTFISSVLKMYRPQFSFKVSLPPKKQYENILPTTEMVKAILDYEQNSTYMVAYSLAVLSLRRSEICALQVEDMSGNSILIHRAKVIDEDENGKKQWIIKEYGKTEKSYRRVYIPDKLRDRITEQGYIYKGCPNNLLKHLNRTQDKLGFPHFRLHDFRHYYSSYAHALGIPDEYIQEQGGWKTDYTMKKIYRHAFEDRYQQIGKTVSEQILPI